MFYHYLAAVSNYNYVLMIITGIGVLCQADTSPVLHMNMENKAQEMRKR